MNRTVAIQWCEDNLTSWPKPNDSIPKAPTGWVWRVQRDDVILKPLGYATYPILQTDLELSA